MWVKKGIPSVSLLLLLTFSSASAAAATTLKFATLAPKQSPWEKVHEPTAAEDAERGKIWKHTCARVEEALPEDVLQKIGYC